MFRQYNMDTSRHGVIGDKANFVIAIAAFNGFAFLPVHHVQQSSLLQLNQPDPIMWSARLRPPSARWPISSRALSSIRGRGVRRGPRNSITRPEPIPAARREAETPPQSDSASIQPQDAQNPHYDPSQNTLLSPVHLPEDPNGVLKSAHPATNILANSGLVIQRQLEMMNIMM